MQRGILYIFIFGLTMVLFAACSEDKGDGTHFIEPGEMQSVDLRDTCSCDSLIENEAGLITLNGEVYTGVCRSNYPNSDKRYITKDYMNGLLHGEVTFFDPTGAVLMEEVYTEGNKKRNGGGAPQNCDCSELVQKNVPGIPEPRFMLDDLPFTGMCEEKYPNSDQTYLEIYYKDGLRDGFVTYFDRNGGTMFMEKYERGQLIKTINEEQK